MHWRLLVSLLHLLLCDSLAGPVIYEAFQDDVAAVGSQIRQVRQSAPLRVAGEVEDLMGASNAQRESRDAKKRAKNASGTFAIVTYCDLATRPRGMVNRVKISENANIAGENHRDADEGLNSNL